MHNVVSAELYKIWRNKTLMINLLVIIGVCLMLVGMLKLADVIVSGNISVPDNVSVEVTTDTQGNVDIGSTLLGSSSGDAAELPFVVFDQMSQLFMLCLAIFVGINAVKDFENGCIKNVIMTGRQRSHWLAAKMLNMLITSALFVVASTVVCTIGFMLVFRFSWLTPFTLGYVGRLLGYLLSEIAVCFTYGSLFMMMALLIRNVGGAIGAGIGITLLDSLLYQFMALLDHPVLKAIVRVMPATMMERLSRIAANTAEATDVLYLWLVVVGITVVSTAVSTLSMEKRDIC